MWLNPATNQTETLLRAGDIKNPHIRMLTRLEENKAEV
jgi:hypothetical protein